MMTVHQVQIMPQLAGRCLKFGRNHCDYEGRRIGERKQLNCGALETKNSIELSTWSSC